MGHEFEWSACIRAAEEGHVSVVRFMYKRYFEGLREYRARRDILLDDGCYSHRNVERETWLAEVRQANMRFLWGTAMTNGRLRMPAHVAASQVLADSAK